MSSGTEKTDRNKLALRADMLARRRVAHEADGTAAIDLKRHFFDRFGYELSGKVVAAYWPIRGEIDVRPVLEELSAHGAAAALPSMAGQTEPLAFRRWQPGDTLVSAAFGVSEPCAAAPAAIPDIVIVPLLGFDSACNRLGYGGGYYDRTLTALRASRQIRAVGACYDAQECEKIPVHPGDARLDMVLTERRMIEPHKDESTD